MVEENQKYGRLTTQYIVGLSKNRNKIWHCICECGNEIDVPTGSLSSGNTKSCGCLLQDSIRKYGEAHRLLNKYDLSGEYGIGYTSKNEPFYFDKEDYEIIKKYTWRLNELGYVVSTPFGKNLRMHILIMNPARDMVVDHINHNPSDNRKANLRICDIMHNQMNQKTRSDNTSGRKGVYYDKSRDKWMVCITAFKKTHNIGRYDSFEEAVKAREMAELKYFGEYNSSV